MAAMSGERDELMGFRRVAARLQWRVSHERCIGASAISRPLQSSNQVTSQLKNTATLLVDLQGFIVIHFVLRDSFVLG
jgi:hypothetical protein